MEQWGAVKGNTIHLSLEDVSATLQSLCDGILGPSYNFSKVAGCLITAETADVRIAFGRTATSAVGHIIPSGTTMRIPSRDHFLKAQVLPKTALSSAALQVTLEEN